MIGLVAGSSNFSHSSLIKMSEKYPEMRWIGVDKGTLHIIRSGLKCEWGIGDFDSITEEERGLLQRHTISLKEYPKDKNESDLELALTELFLEGGGDDIYIYGATGGRLDHQFATIMILTNNRFSKRRIYLVDEQNLLSVFHAGSYTFTNDDYKYWSIIPITNEVNNLTLRGFLYNLDGVDLKRDQTRGISNEILGREGYIYFSSGICLVVRSNDLERLIK